jgi:hypothetical protein
MYYALGDEKGFRLIVGARWGAKPLGSQAPRQKTRTGLRATQQAHAEISVTAPAICRGILFSFQG